MIAALLLLIALAFAKQEFGAKQKGICAKAPYSDQNEGVLKASIQDESECLEWCENHSRYLTGCEHIYGPQSNWGCYGHTYEVARGNGQNYHTCWIKIEKPSLGARENGFCVTRSGDDQRHDIIRSDDYFANIGENSCYSWCSQQTGITGCVFVWGQSNFGCYVHHSAVSHGNGQVRHYCWIAQRRNLQAGDSKLLKL